MAQGPMSVGSPDVINFITDKTLTQENIAADAKVVGQELDKRFQTAGGTFGGDIGFSQIGGTSVSNKLVYPTAAGNVRVYAQTVGDGTARLVLDIPAGTDTRVVIGKNGAQMSYFDQNGIFHGNLEGTASYATNAGDADTVDNVHFKHDNLGAGAGENDELLVYSGAIINEGTTVRTVNYRTLANIYSHTMTAYSKTAGGSAYGGKGYVRFQNGLQVCWGEGNAKGYIAFDQPFIDTSYTVMLTPMRDVLHDYYVSGKSAAGFNMKQNGSSSTATTTYFAYGWWKEPITLDW